MNRSRDYYRKMRAKHIKRKKRIVSHWHWFENGYYPHDGMYSKNKIHCSCPLCKEKAYYGKHILTNKEIDAINTLKEFIEQPYAEFLCSGDYEIVSNPPKPNPPKTLKPLTNKDIYGPSWQFID